MISFLEQVRRRLGQRYIKITRNALDLESQNQQIQRQIVNQYRHCRSRGVKPYEKLVDAGFRVHSEFEEDGIILYVLSMIEPRSRRVVEMCCGDGNQCMATNLILNHGFTGVLFEGDPSQAAQAHKYFESKQDTKLMPPKIVGGWITRENINSLLDEHDASGEVDLLSLDIDGNDYWVLQAIRNLNPRLIVCETHDIIPSHLSLVMPYDPEFNFRSKPNLEQDFRSASLRAMTNLCRERGYRLIGSHRHGFNVFYLRNDEGGDFFPEVTIESVHQNPYTTWGQTHRWPSVRDKPWVRV